MPDRFSLKLPQPPAPWLAERFCPAGPPRLEGFEAAGARVVAVPGRYCVAYLIEGDERLVLVDVGSSADVELLAAVVAELGKPVELLVPSHLHFDHVLGVDRAAERFGAPLALPKLAQKRWAAGRALRQPRLASLGEFLPTWLWQGLPVFARDDWARVGGLLRPLAANPFAAAPGPGLGEGDGLPGCPGWRVLCTPGHADEALCLHHARAGFLVTGDTLRNFLGGEWNPLLTDPDDYRVTRARLSRLDLQAIFPGHGPVITGRDRVGRLLRGWG